MLQKDIEPAKNIQEIGQNIDVDIDGDEDNKYVELALKSAISRFLFNPKLVDRIPEADEREKPPFV